jgi:cysteine desulfurase
MRRIYLDHTATTPLDPRVLEAMRPFWADTFGNPSSIHWHGRQSRKALEESRETIAAAIGARPGELFFTSGGTESDNLAITGAARKARAGGRNRVVTSAAEHHAVLDTCLALQGEGCEVSVLRPDETGRLSATSVEGSIDGCTSVVSVMHGNNEVGTITRLREIADAAHAQGALLHTDAVQTLGRIPVDVEALGADLLTISAHKLYGPRGIGALYIRRGTGVEPLLHGGGQERGTRPGTESVALAAGFAKAVEIAVAELEAESNRLARLRDALQARVIDEFPAAVVNGHPAERLPHILNISFDNRLVSLEGEMLLMNMDLLGVSVTSGSACSSGSMQPSHVLLAMGRDPQTARGTLRFSFGKGNTEEDVEEVVRRLKEAVTRMTS